MKIVADENMAAVAQLFSPFGEVVSLPGRTMTADDLRDADALLVRSVTTVNRALLEGTLVRFVGSATIGTDHIDLDYLAERDIPFAHAPGCNADAVVDYVLATLFAVEDERWQEKAVAIVGCGNVGGRLYRRMKQLGVRCLCYDPFLNAGQQADLCELDDLAQADILCLHTPLTRGGPHPTHHLFDRQRLATLKQGALLINAGRGAVIDGRALLEQIDTGRLRAVLDVWEHEPAIDPRLLKAVLQGTPHIAGYSLEGRLRGSLMVHLAFCRWLGEPPVAGQLAPLLDGEPEPADIRCPQNGGDYQKLQTAVRSAYDPGADAERLIRAATGDETPGAAFDRLRREYPLRREFAFRRVEAAGNSPLRRKLEAIGFSIR